MAYVLQFSEDINLAQELRAITKEARKRGYTNFSTAESMSYLKRSLESDPCAGEPIGSGDRLMLGKHPLCYEYSFDETNQIVHVFKVKPFYFGMPSGYRWED